MYAETFGKHAHAQEQSCAQGQHQWQKQVDTHARHIAQCKKHQQEYQSRGQPGNILPLQSPKDHGFVDPFIDLICTTHKFGFVGYGRSFLCCFSASPCLIFRLDAKKGLQYGGHDHQKDTAAEPGRRYLVGVGLPGVPFRKDFHRTDQPQYRTDGIHQVAACIKIAPDLTGGLVDAGRTVLCHDRYTGQAA